MVCTAPDTGALVPASSCVKAAAATAGRTGCRNRLRRSDDRANRDFVANAMFRAPKIALSEACEQSLGTACAHQGE